MVRVRDSISSNFLWDQLQMKKLIFIIIALSSFAISKNYNTAIGIRGGNSTGVTFKHFISDKNALEGIISSRWRGVQIDALWESHRWDFSTKDLYWFFGGGAYIAFFDDYSDHPWRDDQDVNNLLGVSGITGLEYKLANYPFNFTLDWKPYLNVIGDLRFQAVDFSLSIRYTF